MIAEYRLEQALASKMPDARREVGQVGRFGGPTPTADELASFVAIRQAGDQPNLTGPVIDGMENDTASM